MNRENSVVRVSLVKIDLNMIDFILVPGLGFNLNATTGHVAKILSSKDHYNDLLRSSEKCFIIDLGFNEKFFMYQVSILCFESASFFGSRLRN